MARLKRYGYHKKSGRKALPDDKALSKNIRFRTTTFDLFYQFRDMVNEDEVNGIVLLKFLLDYDGKVPELMQRIVSVYAVHHRAEEILALFQALTNDINAMHCASQRAIESGNDRSAALYCVSQCPHFKFASKTVRDAQRL